MKKVRVVCILGAIGLIMIGIPLIFHFQGWGFLILLPAFLWALICGILEIWYDYDK